VTGCLVYVIIVLTRKTVVQGLQVEQNGAYEEEYDQYADPKFLTANDEWLAKVRQVHRF
jgi:hypothetical protein